MDFLSSLGFESKLIDLGTVRAFKSRITRLNKKIRGRKFRFREMSASEEGHFWLFEAEDADEILGGVLQIREGRVYAIPEDVLALIDSEFARKA